MALTVVTPAPSTDLVSLASVKQHLALNDTSADEYLRGLIRRVSDAIVTACGRPFAQAKVTETFPGDEATQVLLLSLTPIVSVDASGVVIDGVVVSDATIQDARAGFLYREAGWPTKHARRAPLTGDIIPGTAAPSIAVTYTGGYVLETFDAGTPDLPGVIETLALDMVADRYKARGRDRGITQERIGDWSATFSGPAQERIRGELAGTGFVRLA